MKRSFRFLFSILLMFTLIFHITLINSSQIVYATTTWQYTALGDSLGWGYGGWYGYVPRYRDAIRYDTGNSVNLTNKSVLGWTSSDLLNAIITRSDFRADIARARVITWDIGGNDLLDARDRYISRNCGGKDNEDCLRNAVTLFRSNWDQIVTQIISLRNGDIGNLRTMDLYNPYVDEDKAAKSYDGTKTRFDVFRGYLDQVNHHIYSQSFRGYKVAKVYDVYNGANHDIDPSIYGYICFDGLHPNDKGYSVIASQFRKLGYDY